MRRPVFLLAILVCAVVRAQDQDPGLLLQTRNQGLASALFQNRSFYEGKTFNGTGTGVQLKEFYIAPRSNLKEFPTKAFSSATFAQSDITFATKDASTKKDTRDEKTYETKAAPVKTARESGKAYDTRDYADSHQFIPDGKSQKALDQQRAQKPMTIDQVRELLNKNK